MFLRKSREDIEAERVGKFETLAKHESVLSRLAQDRGLTVVHVYKELVSGASLSERDEAMAMLSDVRSGAYDGVLAFDLQRITRGDMVDQGTIMRVFALTGTAIVTPQKTYDPRDELDGNFAELEMMFGRMELARITRRLVSGKEEAVRQGQYIGSIAPFGWRKVVRGRMKTLEPGDDHRELVRIYEDIASWRRTPDKIADDFNQIGFATPRGKHWDGGTVSYIVRNPVNKGYVRWNQRKTVKVLDDGMAAKKSRRKTEDQILVEGLHRGTGDISDDLWQAANDQLDRHTRSKEYSYRPLQNPLATLLVCAKCGRTMLRIMNMGGGKSQPWYIHPKSNRYECHAVSARLDIVVDALADSLAGIAEDIEARLEDDGVARDALEQRKADLCRAEATERSAIENLFRLAEKGFITDDEFSARKRAAEARIAGIRDQRASVEKAAGDMGSQRALVVSIREALSALKDYQGRVKEVNEFLKSFIRRIEYEKDPQTKEIHLEVFFW